MKIVFIPPWLNSHLKEKKISLDEFVSGDVDILSQTDILNYFIYQCDCLNFLFSEYAETEKFPNYLEMMCHKYDDRPDAALSLHELIGRPSDTTHYFHKPITDVKQKTVIFVGRSTRPGVPVDVPPATPRSILSDYLGAAHSLNRIGGRSVDKSSALRENPEMFKYYIDVIFKC